MSKWYAYAVSLCLSASVAWPLLWSSSHDSFPLSNYPMFSRPKASAKVTLQYAVGLGADGTRQLIAPRFVANEEVLQARVVLARAVSRGPSAALALCGQIAGRVAGSDSLSAVETIRLVTGTHDAIRYLAGEVSVGQEKTHAECAVNRAAPRASTHNPEHGP